MRPVDQYLLGRLRTWRASVEIMCLNRKGSLSSRTDALWDPPWDKITAKQIFWWGLWGSRKHLKWIFIGIHHLTHWKQEVRKVMYSLRHSFTISQASERSQSQWSQSFDGHVREKRREGNPHFTLDNVPFNKTQKLHLLKALVCKHLEPMSDLY